MITLTLTTCKRPELFCQTITEFSKNCLDKYLISEVLWADDHSSEEEYTVMRECLYRYFPMQVIKHLRRSDGSRGLGYSLNSILSNLNTKYTYHLEDDFHHDRAAFQIIPSIFIMREFPFVKQVLLNERPSFFKTVFTRDNTTFKLWERGVIQDNGEPVKHFGFSLNPTVTDMEFFKDGYGYFNLSDVEGSYVQSYDSKEQVRTACLDGIKLIHTGNISSFNLNGTNR